MFIYIKLYIFALNNYSIVFTCSKYTKVMPLSVQKLKPNEKRTIERIENAAKISCVLKEFYQMGFKDFKSFKVIVMHYGVEVEEKKLLDFWTFRWLDNEFLSRIDVVLNKLKSE